jgi:hypothetical protein
VASFAKINEAVDVGNGRGTATFTSVRAAHAQYPEVLKTAYVWQNNL